MPLLTLENPLLFRIVANGRAFLHRINAWPNRRWLWLAVALLFLLYGFTAVRNQSTIIDGQRLFWLQDDMMISMIYGRNLARGEGLVWTAGGERVEGYSNFAWVLVMAAVHRLPLPAAYTSLAIVLVNMGLAALVIVLTTRLISRLEPQPGLLLPVILIILVINSDLARWTTLGLETTLLTAVFLWLILRVLYEAEVNEPRPLTFFLAGTLGLIRADGLILSATLCLLAFLLSPNRRQILHWAPLILVLPAAHLLFRYHYYGYLWPNTYYLKISGWTDERFLAGLYYGLRFLRFYGLALLVTAVGLWHHQDRQVWALAVIGAPLVVYALYVGGDDFGGLRFLAPWLPILITLAFLTPRRLASRSRPFRYAINLVLITFTFFILVRTHFHVFLHFEAHMARAGLTLRDAALADSQIGVFGAGTLIYFAERPGVDLLGKNDAYVAHLPANPGSLHPGHNKFDYHYSLGHLQPDFLIDPYHPGAIGNEENLKRLAQGDFAYVGHLYLNPLFQEQYAPSLFFIGQLPIYIHAHSAERERFMENHEANDCMDVIASELQALGLNRVCWPFGRE